MMLKCVLLLLGVVCDVSLSSSFYSFSRSVSRGYGSRTLQFSVIFRPLMHRPNLMARGGKGGRPTPGCGRTLGVASPHRLRLGGCPVGPCRFYVGLWSVCPVVVVFEPSLLLCALPEKSLSCIFHVLVYNLCKTKCYKYMWSYVNM